jgi:starch synthase
MKIAFVSSEVFPFAKTGGLADVSSSLPVELSKLGADIKVFMPKYYHVEEEKYNLQYMWTIGEIPVRIAGRVYQVQIYKSKIPGSSVDIYFIDCPHFFHRHAIYTNDKDEDERFLFFNKAVIEFIQRIQWKPDIFHCNDWQTGLLPLLVKENYSWDKAFDKTAFLFTIHNVAYQGLFDRSILHKGEITEKYFYPCGPVEYCGSFSFLKAGIVFSEMVNTVSENYAKELLTPEYGEGMQDVLKEKGNNFYGIINGIDYDTWDPETDKLIYYNYSLNDMSGKLKNKRLLCGQMNLAFDENIPLIGIIMRLVTQKGIDIIMEALPGLIHLNAQWVILGSGDWKYEQAVNNLAKEHPSKFSVYLGFNDQLSHQIEAGADLFLMPSHFEPCGLNQIYSLKYGTVPIVRKTGGLADTVQDWDEYSSVRLEIGTGFSFNDYSGFAMEQSVKRALGYFHNKSVWNKIQSNGMLKDYSWKKSAEKYLQLYTSAINKRKPQ